MLEFNLVREENMMEVKTAADEEKLNLTNFYGSIYVYVYELHI